MFTEIYEELKIVQLYDRKTRQPLYDLLDYTVYGKGTHIVETYVNKNNENFPRYLTVVNREIPYLCIIAKIDGYDLEGRRIYMQLDESTTRILVNHELKKVSVDINK